MADHPEDKPKDINKLLKFINDSVREKAAEKKVAGRRRSGGVAAAPRRSAEATAGKAAPPSRPGRGAERKAVSPGRPRPVVETGSQKNRADLDGRPAANPRIKKSPKFLPL